MAQVLVESRQGKSRINLVLQLLKRVCMLLSDYFSKVLHCDTNIILFSQDS